MAILQSRILVRLIQFQVWWTSAAVLPLAARKREDVSAIQWQLCWIRCPFKFDSWMKEESNTELLWGHRATREIKEANDEGNVPYGDKCSTQGPSQRHNENIMSFGCWFSGWRFFSVLAAQLNEIWSGDHMAWSSAFLQEQTGEGGLLVFTTPHFFNTHGWLACFYTNCDCPI